MIVGLTTGTFDLFHFSHLLYLERCKAQCDKLIVGVDSDALVRKIKGPTRPIFSQLHRYNLVASLSMVDTVFILDDPQRLTGIAYSFAVSKFFRCQGWENRHVYGAEDAELVILPDYEGMISTSRIVEAIKNGETTLGPIPVRSGPSPG